MRTFIDQYRRPILAIFGVLLMIVFMLPANFKGGMGGRNNPVIGHIGKDAVHAADASTAQGDWEILTRNLVFRTGNERQPFIPLAAALLPHDPSGRFSAYMPINERRDTFLLLAKEAELHGVTVTNDELNSFLDNPNLVILDRGGRQLAFSDLENINMDEAERYREAVGRLLMVRRMYDNAANTIKVSQPLRHRFLAEQTQTIDMALVDTPTAQFTTAAPTQQQLEEQFKKYADVNPDDHEKSPYGYGYRFPNRVKLQSIEVPLASVRAAAERKRTADAPAQYEWDRDAFKYYTANQSAFAATQPTTGTATKAATTRPFAEVKQQARQAVLDNDVTKLAQRVVERITTQMAGDYVGYRNALNTGGAKATPPATSVGPAYNTYEYLQKLAEQVQATFGVLPVVNSFDKDYLTYRDLAALPGLGQSFVENQPFPSYVMGHADAFNPGIDDSKTLQPFEPSPNVIDDMGNVSVFRLSSMQPAHAPTNIQEVAAAVERDVRAQNAFDQAKAVAEQLLAKAKQSGSLASVAPAGKLVNIPGLRFNNPMAIASLNLSESAQGSFLRQAFDLMSTGSKENPHPIGLIELPRDGHAFVAQVTDVRSDLTPEILAALDARANTELTGDLSLSLLATWFNYDAVATRLNYQPTAANENATPSAPSNPNSPPANQPLF